MNPKCRVECWEYQTCILSNVGQSPLDILYNEIEVVFSLLIFSGDSFNCWAVWSCNMEILSFSVYLKHEANGPFLASWLASSESYSPLRKRRKTKLLPVSHLLLQIKQIFNRVIIHLVQCIIKQLFTSRCPWKRRTLTLPPLRWIIVL